MNKLHPPWPKAHRGLGRLKKSGAVSLLPTNEQDIRLYSAFAKGPTRVRWAEMTERCTDLNYQVRKLTILERQCSRHRQIH